MAADLALHDVIVQIAAALLQAVSIVLVTLLIGCAKVALNWLGLRMNAAQRQEMDEIAQKSLLHAMAVMTDPGISPQAVASAAMVDPVQREAVIDSAMAYAKSRFPGEMTRSAARPSGVSFNEKLHGLMLRSLPVSAGQLAAPPTPPILPPEKPHDG